MRDLSSIVKAYDIRGVVPDQLDESVAEAVGAAFARLTGAATIVTVHDMRASSAPLADAFGRGAAAQGADVLSGGLGSTDILYYASGSLGMAGAMVTASHNPARYNGIKLCREGARPGGADTGRPVRHPPAEGGGGCGQRHGRLYRACGFHRPAAGDGAALLRAGRLVS